MKTFPDPYMTVVDACAQIARCDSVPAITEYAETLPEPIKADERFTRAVKSRIAELRTPARRTA